MFSLNEEADETNAFSRRDFLHSTSRGLLAATLTGGLTYCTHSSSGPPPENKPIPSAPKNTGLETPPKLPALNRDTEKKVDTPESFLPPEKKIGMPS